MPQIDREKFAYAVAGRIARRESDTVRALQAESGISGATWTRIRQGAIISADNFAAVCKFLDLDAREFVDMLAPNPHSQHGRAQHGRAQHGRAQHGRGQHGRPETRLSA